VDRRLIQMPVRSRHPEKYLLIDSETKQRWRGSAVGWRPVLRSRGCWDHFEGPRLHDCAACREAVHLFDVI